MSYAHAPISEAVLDIQTLDLACDMEALRALGQDTPEFSEVREISKNELQFNFPPDSAVPVTEGRRSLHGFQFWNADRTKVWQARGNGFSVSHLHPYQSWEALTEEAKRLWSLFRSRTGATPTRLAVRYINRFDVPNTSRLNFADFFRLIPSIPPELDTGLAGFLMQLNLPQIDLESVAVVTQTPAVPIQPDTASLILDIDLFRDRNVPQEDEQIWALFEQFRIRKNHIFEMSLHESARELIR
ncbi:MAG: TIGR04255 family protein [Geothrix sp.]|nr:TIGR04255 family protein [Geothrix sp.]